ncbi:MAG: GIY-YIG nuclease family protein [Candidatus Gracilibacteria bacterium]
MSLLVTGASNGKPLKLIKCKLSMYYVYILQSINFPKQFYTGFSENIHERLNNHNEGKSIHTNKFKPWKMIYYCVFDNKKKALDFEKYLKSSSGTAFRNKRLIGFF